ncbi:uncharacterized protein LOC132044535 [Lycium ferocissimum]|uniref:uncharacterized protein LOC132044535 n=1 Tax=Lycium ferocissimum TaxID=112874 RepID=UPI00281687C6|nr:uncharacterized protein LOC132044535 [Lycium ferocissimum]
MGFKERQLSKLEDLEIEKQLHLLNKLAVKTIKTIYGDTYDCVDFNKQLAFDHPLLKNHNFHPQPCLLNVHFMLSFIEMHIRYCEFVMHNLVLNLQMKPTLATTKQNADNSSTSPASRIWLNGKGYAPRTVPIKRTTKEDLIRHRSMPPPEDVTVNAQLTTTNNNSEPKGIYRSSQEYKVAVARTENNPNNKFAGAEMATSVWNPSVKGRILEKMQLLCTWTRDLDWQVLMHSPSLPSDDLASP